MVQTIKMRNPGPLVQIHGVERWVHGNGIQIHVWGEMLIAAKEMVYAREMKLNTIKVLLLTPEGADHQPVIAKKWIYSKGAYDNYASIDLFDDTGAELYPGRGRDPTGSVWLNFEAKGE